jgi:hypothetical protein
MKLPRLRKLNQRGIAHYIVPLVVIGLVAIGGTAYLVFTHADTLGSTLPAGQTLYAGSVMKITGNYPDGGENDVLSMQTDGNLVLYRDDGLGSGLPVYPLWSSGTQGTGSSNRLVMQTDGNLVVYTSANKAVWSSGTAKTGSNNHLAVQADGNLVVYTSSNVAVWSSGTSTCVYHSFSQGSSGNCVKDIQTLYNHKLRVDAGEVGGSSLTVDGQFGPATAAAVNKVSSLLWTSYPYTSGTVNTQNWWEFCADNGDEYGNGGGFNSTELAAYENAGC